MAGRLVVLHHEGWLHMFGWLHCFVLCDLTFHVLWWGVRNYVFNGSQKHLAQGYVVTPC